MNRRQQELEYSSHVSGHYTMPELEALYDLADGLPKGARVVEIGVLYGRSSSLLMQIGKRQKFDLRFIDPWVVEGKDAAMAFARLTADLQASYTMYVMRSADVQWSAVNKIDLLHIDGDHSPAGIRFDCDWLTLIKQGGFVVFHDYANENFPQVKQAADYMCAQYGFEKVGVTDSQARFIRA